MHFGDQETEHYEQRETNTEESAADMNKPRFNHRDVSALLGQKKSEEEQ